MGMALAFSKSLDGILDTHEFCTGHIKLGKSKHKFRCWASWGHGSVALRRAIRESCDVYFYNKSLRVGIDSMAKHLKSFGLGVKTGVDLPREYNGVMPDKAWKMKRYKQGWYRGETVISAIGQGYDLVTPLQLARYTALVATSKLVTPRIAKIIDNNETKNIIKPMYFKHYYLDQIRKGMYDVCNVKGGTAFHTMRKLPIIVAGKTGTSQVASIPQSTKKRLKEEELKYFLRSHAWITTYAPYTNPKYVVTVLVEHGGHGGSTAGPIAADIYKWLYRHGYFGKKRKKKN
jgi:penicillin-binding protein 2